MPHDDLLPACLAEVTASLAQDEAIVGVRRGLTIFSRNAEIPFMFDIATLDGTGQVTGAKRGVVALATSNSPHAVRLLPSAPLPSITWVPL